MYYPIQVLKNMITDRIHENHERSIDGVDLQEFLHDILDSLAHYTDEQVISPAINYYVNQALFNIATGALTLVRAGGITPVNVSVDLDGRYQLQSASNYRSDQLLVDAGNQIIPFLTPFPAGTTYTIPPLAGLKANGALIWQIPSNLTESGFSVNFASPVTLTYTATIRR